MNRSFIMVFIHFKPDEVSPGPGAGSGRRATAYTVVEDQLSRVSVGPNYVFKQRHRLLCRMQASLALYFKQLTRIMYDTGFRIMGKATVHPVNRITMLLD